MDGFGFFLRKLVLAGNRMNLIFCFKEKVPLCVHTFFLWQNAAALISGVIVAIAFNYLIIIVVIPLVVSFVVIRNVYVNTSRDIKRMEAASEW